MIEMDFKASDGGHLKVAQNKAYVYFEITCEDLIARAKIDHDTARALVQSLTPMLFNVGEDD